MKVLQIYNLYKFVNYIVDAGLKKATEFNFQEIFSSIQSVYLPQLNELLKDNKVANVYEYNSNKESPLEIDFDFDSGIVIKHNGEVIKKEFNSISTIENRIKEIREARKSQEDIKTNNNQIASLPSLKSILK